MKKNNLKLFQNKGDKNNFKICDKKNENILSIGAAVELKNNKICISYKEIEIKKCGFDKIKKIEIYKGSKLICYENKISNFYVEFPYFSSEGIYEIRTTIVNLNDDSQTCVINTFEFFDYKKKVICENFNINLSKVNKNLCVNFNKKFGELDLSEISLSNINLFDSKNNQIKNIACKIYTKINSIDFVILDVFDDNNINKLIPNEVYILRINIKDKEIFSSFSFEYDNIEINAYRVIEDVSYDILSNISDEAISLKLYFKINSFINIDDYDYFISNIRNKFLYFKSSQGEKEDTVVFECVIKNEKNYFELSICKGSSVNIIKFDYDFSSGNSVITQRSYFEIPCINKSLNKYTVEVKSKNLDVDLNKAPFLGISDKFGQLGISFTSKNFVEKGNIVLDDQGTTSIIFENISILNKFSEVYTVELDYEIKESFVFSPSIGVKFNQIKYNTKFDSGNKNLKIQFLRDNCDLIGKYTYDKNKEYKLNILNNSCSFQVENFDVLKRLYLKIYDDKNRFYFETIVLNYIETDPYIKISHSEKFLLDSLNYLTIIDKNVFDDFKKDFGVCVLSEDKHVIQEIKVHSFDKKFKINFDNIQISNSGMYYIKFQKGNMYKICSFFVSKITDPKNLFIKNLDKSGIDIVLSNFKFVPSMKGFLKVNIFLLIDNIRHSFIEQSFSISSQNIRIDFLQNVLINNTEYLAYFEFDKNKKKSISFTYLGDSACLGDIEDNINELSEMLSYNLDDYEEPHYETSLIIEKINKISEESPIDDYYLDENNSYEAQSFDEGNLDDIGIIIKKAYEIFLGVNIEASNREVILWKKLIKDKKVDLKYFIEVFVVEYILKFKPLIGSDLKRYNELVSKIWKFLNIEQNLEDNFIENIEVLSKDSFIKEVFENICETNEYKNVEYILENYR